MNTTSVLKIPCDVYAALDEYHQAVADALQRKGLVVIGEDKPTVIRGAT